MNAAARLAHLADTGGDTHGDTEGDSEVDTVSTSI